MKTKNGMLLSVLALAILFSVNAAKGFEQIYTIQSDWSSLTQSKWFGDYYERNGHSDGISKVGGWGDHYLSMIKIPLHFNVPGRVLINGASLQLYSYGSARPTSMEKLFWLGPWSETSTSDHLNLISSHQYFNLGSIPAPAANGWYSIDISSEFFVWLTGQYQNYGIGLYPDNIDNRFNYFYSPKGPGGGLSLRPFINVRYETIPNLKMPLEGDGKAWKLTTECGGKSFDDHFNSNPDPAHMGQQYFSLDFSHWYTLNGDTVQYDTSGIDVPVLAVADGVVYEVGTDLTKPNGNYVRIDHDLDSTQNVVKTNTGFQTVYIHLKYPPALQKGDVVHQGRRVGFMGGSGTNPDTGLPYPIHLHISFYFQAGAGPHGSDSTQLNFLRMEGRPLTDYKLDTVWHSELSPAQFTPIFYPSSNVQRP